jgi:hypothetical protein
MNWRTVAGIVLIALAGLNSSGWSLPFDRLPIPPFSQKIELKDAWFLVVEESSERPSNLSAIDADMPLRAELKSLGITYLRMDKDLDDATPYRDRAMQHGLPAFLLINGDGKVISEGVLPIDRDGVLKIARQQ